jgi:hypothetical protein
MKKDTFNKHTIVFKTIAQTDHQYNENKKWCIIAISKRHLSTGVCYNFSLIPQLLHRARADTFFTPAQSESKQRQQ